MKIVYNEKTNDYMYRYLEKYVGTYRVLADIDEDSGTFPNSDDFEDYYIPCSRNGVIKHTYVGNDILELCFYDASSTARNVSKELTELGVDHEDDIPDGCQDGIILFNAKDIKKVASVVKPKTNGKNIHPLSVRNLNNGSSAKYTIPDSDLSNLYNGTESMSKTEKLQFFRKVNKAFLEKLLEEDGIDCRARMKIDGLDTKSYMHMTGMWDKYTNFIQENLKTNK